jgi:hypothetical protein
MATHLPERLLVGNFLLYALKMYRYPGTVRCCMMLESADQADEAFESADQADETFGDGNSGEGPPLVDYCPDMVRHLRTYRFLHRYTHSVTI